ncbi:UNVERIFIED_CONTAM: Transcriptional repressor ILP1 [Sesamum calycinum]|uniref:Transcriptional repressor ILP1 n=1 Tax=Sesamum calycinum TaxID=2727403 RepID=A0AAW2QY77_9LAMI
MEEDYASSYRDAYMSLSYLLFSHPMHSLLFNYGLQEDGNEISGEDAEADADANLIPELVEKLAIPILHHQLAHCWDMLSTRETKYAVSAMNLIIRYVNLSSSALAELVTVLRDRLTKAVADLLVPTWSPLEMKAVPNAARVAAYSIQSNVHDAIVRTERIIASLYGVWTGPSVSGDRSRKLQPLVDYLLLIGKTLEKKHASSAMETESGKLVRRLKKMLVELNEYDHARYLSRTFNLKEAL